MKWIKSFKLFESNESDDSDISKMNAFTLLLGSKEKRRPMTTELSKEFGSNFQSQEYQDFLKKGWFKVKEDSIGIPEGPSKIMGELVYGIDYLLFRHYELEDPNKPGYPQFAILNWMEGPRLSELNQYGVLLINDKDAETNPRSCEILKEVDMLRDKTEFNKSLNNPNDLPKFYYNKLIQTIKILTNFDKTTSFERLKTRYTPEVRNAVPFAELPIIEKIPMMLNIFSIKPDEFKNPEKYSDSIAKKVRSMTKFTLGDEEELKNVDNVTLQNVLKWYGRNIKSLEDLLNDALDKKDFERAKIISKYLD